MDVNTLNPGDLVVGGGPMADEWGRTRMVVYQVGEGVAYLMAVDERPDREQLNRLARRHGLTEDTQEDLMSWRGEHLALHSKGPGHFDPTVVGLTG